MNEPLVKTKLHIPRPHSDRVLRPCLIERLNVGAQHKATVISAPPGFGKTTLVSEWIQSRKISSLRGQDLIWNADSQCPNAHRIHRARAR